MAYASLNGKRIQFLPWVHGEYVCHNGRIKLPFLDNMMKAIEHCIIVHNEFGDAMEIQLIDLDLGE